MRRCYRATGLALIALLGVGPAVAINRISYPEITVRPLAPFAGDAALTAMRQRFAETVQRQDLAGLSALVAENFSWTAGGEPATESDSRRDALHNFKVAFGFRPVGQQDDGDTEIGPQWELLEVFANDPTLSVEPNTDEVCGPLDARVTDLGALEQALGRVDEADDLSEWVYFTGELTLTAGPGGGGNVAKAADAAMPVTAIHPPPPEDGTPPARPATHFELLLPSGQTGWAPLDRLRPLFIDELCYAKSGGEWKIVRYDLAE